MPECILSVFRERERFGKRKQGKAEQHSGDDVGGYEVEQEINHAVFVSRAMYSALNGKCFPHHAVSFTTARNQRRNIPRTKLYKFAFAAKFTEYTESLLMTKFILTPISRLKPVKTRFFKHEILYFRDMRKNTWLVAKNTRHLF